MGLSVGFFIRIATAEQSITQQNKRAMDEYRVKMQQSEPTPAQGNKVKKWEADPQTQMTKEKTKEDAEDATMSDRLQGLPEDQNEREASESWQRRAEVRNKSRRLRAEKREALDQLKKNSSKQANGK